MKDLLLAFTFLLLPFFVLATANAAGYRYGAADQAFYGPAVMLQLDPALFPRDAPLLNIQAHLMWADEAAAAAARVLGVDLPPLFFALYLLTLALIAWCALLIGAALYRERWTALALVVAVSLRHAIAKSGTNTLESYYHPRQIAFGLGALAVYAFLRRRYVALLACIAGAAILHPTTALWFSVWLFVATIVAEPKWRLALAGGALAILPLVGWAFWAGPLAGRLVRMDAEWLAAIGHKEYLFPLQWPAYVWAINLGYVAVIVLIWNARRSSGALRPRETAIVAGCLSLVAVFAVALVFQSRAIALAIQLQPARVFWMLDFLTTVYVVWLLAESGPAARPIRAAAVAVVLVLLSSGRAVYNLYVAFPDRPLFEVGIPDDDWGRTMAWARATDRRTGWLAHPLHAPLYGTSVRVAGKRDVFVETQKDAALGIYDRAIAVRTRQRLAELGDFDALTAAHARQLATAHKLDYLITSATLDLPLEFRSGPLRVYRIREAPAAEPAPAAGR